MSAVEVEIVDVDVTGETYRDKINRWSESALNNKRDKQRVNNSVAARSSREDKIEQARESAFTAEKQASGFGLIEDASVYTGALVKYSGGWVAGFGKLETVVLGGVTYEGIRYALTDPEGGVDVHGFTVRGTCLGKGRNPKSRPETEAEVIARASRLMKEVVKKRKGDWFEGKNDPDKHRTAVRGAGVTAGSNRGGYGNVGTV